MRRPARIEPLPGQESVWDYPRPPRLEATSDTVKVELNGAVIAQTQRPFRVLETSHPPVYYIDPNDVDQSVLRPSTRRTFCEFKGSANYYDLVVGERVERQAAWYFKTPTRGFEEMANFIAFYPSRMDACWVNDERVQPQPGDFYGGWITSKIVGPFKGDPGTWGW